MAAISSSRFSLGVRIWHWLNSAVVIGLLATYFLRTTLLSMKVNRQLFVDKLAEREIVVDVNVGKDLARVLVDRLWVWHINLGYVLAALLVFRLVLFLMDRSHPFARLWKFLKKRDLSAHALAVKALYAFFYIIVGLMVLSGLGMVFGEQMGLSERFFEKIEEFHENAMWFFVVFLVLHLTGVIWAEITDDPGLVSRMLHGGAKEKP